MDTSSVLTVVGFVIVWALFHVERSVSRRREIGSAHGLLTAVQQSLFGGDGWARSFFSENWTEERSRQRADETSRLVRNKNFESLFRVPATPGILESLLASPYVGDLISTETAKWVGVSLYRLSLFVQFIEQQSRLVEHHLHELVSLPPDDPRLETLADVFGRQSFMLHRHGLGEPNVPGGWFCELEKAIGWEICRLSCAGRAWMYPPGTGFLLRIGDGIAAAAALATLGVVLSG